MAHYIVQMIIAGVQVVGRAFTRAMQQEIQASQQAAQRLGNARATKDYVDNTRLGLSIEEAKEILNIKDMSPEEVAKRYEFLFKQNEKSNGGSFYIQSKVVRAKERLDHELNSEKTEAKTEGKGEPS